MAISSKKTADFIHQTHSTPVQNDVTIVGTIIGCKIYLIDLTNNILKAIVLVERTEPINLRASFLNPGQYIIQVQFPSGGIFEIQFEKTESDFDNNLRGLLNTPPPKKIYNIGG